jgi:tetratricopeptide (TPR) repeat protein
MARLKWPVALSLTLALMAPLGPTFANDGSKAPPVSRATYQRLDQVQKLLADDKYREALEKLSAALKSVEGNAYETALVRSAQASAYIGQGNYAKAASSLERALATGGLPKERANRAEYDLARLYMALERFRKASNLLAAWLKKNPEPPVEAYVLLGQAFVQQERWGEAISPLRKAIRASSAPKESWYQLLLAAYYERKNYKAGKQLLEVMIRRWPSKPDYWRQLAGMHQLTGDYKQALAVLEMAYTRSLLDSESDLRNLSALYLQQDQPERAARVLSKALSEKTLPPKAKYYTLLGDAHYLARDREDATAALRQSAKLSDNAKTWLRLAQIAAVEERWKDVVEAGNRALGAGTVRDAGNVLLLIGIAHAELGENAMATKVLERAAEHAKTREQAEGWLAYLREDEQLASLAENGASPAPGE